MMTKQTSAALFSSNIGETSSLFAKARSFASQTLHRLNEESEIRQAIWDLEQLDDRALRDIGINRSDIAAIVRRK